MTIVTILHRNRYQQFLKTEKFSLINLIRENFEFSYILYKHF